MAKTPVTLCEWEWDGTSWILVSGLAVCPVPLPTTEPPGTVMNTTCQGPGASLKQCCGASSKCGEEQIVEALSI
jgi:hypothetical protein